MAVYASSALADSELVIGKDNKSERLNFDEEIRLTEQVRERAQLLHDKRSGFSASENRTIRLGDRALTQLLDVYQFLLKRLVRQHQPVKTRGIDADLELEAKAEFIAAVERFDSSKGTRLGSFAYFRVRAKLQTLRDKRNQETIAIAKACKEDLVTEAPEAVDTQRHALLRAAIGLLAKPQQSLAQLLLNDTPYKRIAEILGIDLRAARARCYRVIKKLKYLFNFRLPFLSHLALQPQEIVLAEVPVHAPTEPVEIKPTLTRVVWPKPSLVKIEKLVRRVYAAVVSPGSKPSFQACAKSALQGLSDLITKLTPKAIRAIDRAAKPLQPPCLKQGATAMQDPLMLQRVSKLRQSPWRLLPYGFMLCVSTIGAILFHNPVLGCIGLALWLGVTYAWGVERLGALVGVNRVCRRWISRIGTSGISLLSAPGMAIAAPTTRGQDVCPHPGFLAQTANSWIMSIATWDSTDPTLSPYVCNSTGFFLLYYLLLTVALFLYGGYSILTEPQMRWTKGFPLVVGSAALYALGSALRLPTIL